MTGARHLIWDAGLGVNNDSVKKSGVAVVGLSLIGTAYLMSI